MLKRRKQPVRLMGESDMANAQTHDPTRQKPLRLWPGVIIVILQWLIWLGVPNVVSDMMAGVIGAFGNIFGGLAIIVWWAFFSRAPRLERWGAVVLMVAAVFATSRILHESVATGGMGYSSSFTPSRS